MMKGMQRESIVVLVIENSNNLLTCTCKEINFVHKINLKGMIKRACF